MGFDVTGAPHALLLLPPCTAASSHPPAPFWPAGFVPPYDPKSKFYKFIASSRQRYASKGSLNSMESSPDNLQTTVRNPVLTHLDQELTNNPMRGKRSSFFSRCVHVCVCAVCVREEKQRGKGSPAGRSCVETCLCVSSLSFSPYLHVARTRLHTHTHARTHTHTHTHTHRFAGSMGSNMGGSQANAGAMAVAAVAGASSSSPSPQPGGAVGEGNMNQHDAEMLRTYADALR